MRREAPDQNRNERGERWFVLKRPRCDTGEGCNIEGTVTSSEELHAQSRENKEKKRPSTRRWCLDTGARRSWPGRVVNWKYIPGVSTTVDPNRIFTLSGRLKSACARNPHSGASSNPRVYIYGLPMVWKERVVFLSARMKSSRSSSPWMRPDVRERDMK